MKRSTPFCGLLTLGIITACSSSDDRARAAIDSSPVAVSCARWVAALTVRGLTADAVFRTPGFSVAASYPSLMGLSPDDRSAVLGAFSPDDRSAVLGALTRECVAVTSLGGSQSDAAFLERCQNALIQRSANDVAIPLACVPPAGTRGDGDGCVGDHQCASLHCAGASATQCGHCAPALAVGAGCAVDCGFGLGCIHQPIPGSHGGYGFGTCSVSGLEEPHAKGCVSTSCTAGSYCDTKLDACVPLLAAGAACNFFENSCAAGLTCDRTATCVVARALGAACDVSVDCGIDAYCKPSNPPTDPGGPGVCTAGAALGQPCDNWYVQCGRQAGVLCSKAACGTEQVCKRTDSPGALPGLPGETATGHGCVFMAATTGMCGLCPRAVADGEACGADLACLPGSACTQGVCRPNSPACP